MSSMLIASKYRNSAFRIMYMEKYILKPLLIIRMYREYILD